MKKNGFISISIIYAFFLVFISLMLFIVTNMVVNRNMLSKMKEQIKEDLNTTSFAKYLLSLDTLKREESDNSYRYTGATPNNYLKIDNELYRIISVSNSYVKVITLSSIGDYSYGDTINESFSSLNTYLNSIQTSFFTSYDFLLPSINKNLSNTDYINYEIGEDKTTNVFNSLASLPLISDYLCSGDATGNWLNSNMWFITNVNDSNEAFALYNGNIIANDITTNRGVRPVMYLKKNIKYLSGTGEFSQPFIVG